MLFTVTGTGRLVANAEVKVETENSKLVEFRVANSESVKRGGEYVEETTFTTVKTWLPKASKLPQYLVKGQEIFILGKLKQENWESEGQKRSKLVIVSMEIQLVGGSKKSDTGNGGSVSETPAPSKETPAAPANEPTVDVDDDEIPF